MLYDRRDPGRVARNQAERTMSFQAPRRGWVRNGSLAKPRPESAEVLDNFFPTTEGARIRRGASKHATLGGACTAIMSYDAGGVSKLFAADASNVYDVTAPADADVAPTADIASLTGGDWISTQFSTSGGDFLVMVNGADTPRNYNGSAWATTPAITGATPADLDFVWSHKFRLWFVEAGAMSAWYLPVSSIGGLAVEFPLGPVFKHGGALLFGATWSIDAGDGIDDVCVFVTTEGEVAIYEGTDPSSATTWALSGVYRIGRPLGKRAHFKAGGDLAIATDDGIIPLSQAIQKDRAGLSGSAITAPIDDEWRGAVKTAPAGREFITVLWPRETMLFAAVPASTAVPQVFVSNSTTGAWARYTGWDARAVGLLQDQLYFGDADTFIYQAESGGSDNGAPYTAIFVPKFETGGNAGTKEALRTKMVARSLAVFDPLISACADYAIELPAAPSALLTGTALWDSGVWNTSVWGADGKMSVSRIEATPAVGYALAPALQITIGEDVAPEIDLIAFFLTYAEGDMT